jgi:hypothetical protein
MQIVFSNKQILELVLDSNPVADAYTQIYKHLQHVLVPFRDWDNPFYCDQLTLEQRVQQLMIHGDCMKISIDQDSCMKQDQSYFNYIHTLYENNYNGDPTWLDFHEFIHLCEKKSWFTSKFCNIDYREKSGLLERKLDKNWLRFTKTKIQAGDVYVSWMELGKGPVSYWKDCEPDDEQSLHRLCKPWVTLKPTIKIALEDTDFLQNVDQKNFNSWWSGKCQAWCRHWNLEEWSLNNMFGVLVFGTVPKYDELSKLLQKKIKPVQVKL